MALINQNFLFLQKTCISAKYFVIILEIYTSLKYIISAFFYHHWKVWAYDSFWLKYIKKKLTDLKIKDFWVCYRALIKKKIFGGLCGFGHKQWLISMTIKEIRYENEMNSLEIPLLNFPYNTYTSRSYFGVIEHKMRAYVCSIFIAPVDFRIVLSKILRCFLGSHAIVL